MTILKARNVNGLLMPALRLIQAEGQPVSSRAGPVLTVPWPVMSVYERPRERVLLHPLRHCNPFFHFFEAMWMLAGRNDVEYLEQFVPRMATFAEDNGLLHGAYGYRWRKHYDFDQIDWAVKHLANDPSSRRCVINMWDPDADNEPKNDLPCNTQLMFRVVGNALNMTVLNRSNDAIWGAYGANCVHFSFLQEFMACALELEVGRMFQFTNNLHIYLENAAWKRFHTAYFPEAPDVYSEGLERAPLIGEGCGGSGPQTRGEFMLREIKEFLYDPVAYEDRGSLSLLLSVGCKLWRLWHPEAPQIEGPLPQNDWFQGAAMMYTQDPHLLPRNQPTKTGETLN